MKKPEPDYYGVLGVRRDAALGAVKQAYRELVRRCHPDAAGDSPSARKQFDLLQAAYEVLSDPSKRAQYDKQLPPQKYPLAELEPATLWREATEVILERSDSFGSMLQAMRVAVGISLEGDLLIVGVAGKDQYLAGHLETPANRHRITEALREIAGRGLEYRAIEGTTLEDWEYVKRGEGRRTHVAPPVSAGPEPITVGRAPAQEGKAVGAVKPEVPLVTDWDLLGRKIQNTWQGTPNRQHAVTRAEFLFTCVNWIAETAKEATGDGAQRDAIQREIGRAVEKVAQLLEVPPTVVAMELVRGHQRRRAG